MRSYFPWSVAFVWRWRAEGDVLLAIGREVCSFCLRAGFDCWILQLADQSGGVPVSLFAQVSIIGFCDLPA